MRSSSGFSRLVSGIASVVVFDPAVGGRERKAAALRDELNRAGRGLDGDAVPADRLDDSAAEEGQGQRVPGGAARDRGLRRKGVAEGKQVRSGEEAGDCVPDLRDERAAAGEQDGVDEVRLEVGAVEHVGQRREDRAGHAVIGLAREEEVAVEKGLEELLERRHGEHRIGQRQLAAVAEDYRPGARDFHGRNVIRSAGLRRGAGTDPLAEPDLERFGQQAEGRQDRAGLVVVVEGKRRQRVLLLEKRNENLLDDRRVDVAATEAVIARDCKGGGLERAAAGSGGDAQDGDIAGAAPEIENQDVRRAARRDAELRAAVGGDPVEKRGRGLVQESALDDLQAGKLRRAERVLALRRLERGGNPHRDRVRGRPVLRESRLVEELEDVRSDLRGRAEARRSFGVTPEKAHVVLGLGEDVPLRDAADLAHAGGEPLGRPAHDGGVAIARDDRGDERARVAVCSLGDFEAPDGRAASARRVPGDLRDGGVRRAEVDAEHTDRAFAARDSRGVRKEAGNIVHYDRPLVETT